MGLNIFICIMRLKSRNFEASIKHKSQAEKKFFYKQENDVEHNISNWEKQFMRQRFPQFKDST